MLFTVYVGSRAIPFLLDRVAETRSRELFTLTVLVVALGIAVGAMLFDVSVALLDRLGATPEQLDRAHRERFGEPAA